jgi:DNA-binding NarL/FixJ family response regulator
MPEFESKIADDIEKGLPIKQIAFRWNTTRRVVEGVKEKFFRTLLVRKDNIPAKEQLTLFQGHLPRRLFKRSREP